MVKTNLFHPAVIITPLLFFILGGCVGKSPPSQLYRLTPLAESQSGVQAKPTHNIAVGIGPVTVADYLDQNKIVTRSSENKIDQAEFDQWSGTFKNNVTEVLAENLGVLLGSERISIYPWRSYMSVEYQVQIDITRCDGQLGKDAVLAARWSVLKGKEKKLVAMKKSSITQALESAEYTALVSAYSRAFGELSREITGTIQAEAKK